jgi:hypothetical protein
VDALDQAADAAADLLARVDEVLWRVGAPAEHPVWPLLRRLRALPGDAVGAVAALRPGPLAGAGSVLRPLADAYEDVCRTTAAEPAWDGAAAGAYAARRSTLNAHLAGDRAGAGLAGRVRDTASYAEAVAAWMLDSRRAVAQALVDVLTCAEAVTVRVGTEPSPALAAAAADIAARVLAPTAGAYDAADALYADWAGRLAEAPAPDEPDAGLPAVPGPSADPGLPAAGGFRLGG